jgi:Flp pilus assembly protein TadG
MQSRKHERGSALVEAAITVPILLLLMVGIFEVGRALETWQVLTNAAREGARMSTTPGADSDTAKALVKKYMADGALSNPDAASVDVNRAALISVNGKNVGASLVTVDYPFQFLVLRGVARLVNPASTAGQDFTMRASALMRNEAQ